MTIKIPEWQMALEMHRESFSDEGLAGLFGSGTACNALGERLARGDVDPETILRFLESEGRHSFHHRDFWSAFWRDYCEKARIEAVAVPPFPHLSDKTLVALERYGFMFLYIPDIEACRRAKFVRLYESCSEEPHWSQATEGLLGRWIAFDAVPRPVLQEVETAPGRGRRWHHHRGSTFGSPGFASGAYDTYDIPARHEIRGDYLDGNDALAVDLEIDSRLGKPFGQVSERFVPRIGELIGLPGRVRLPTLNDFTNAERILARLHSHHDFGRFGNRGGRGFLFGGAAEWTSELYEMEAGGMGVCLADGKCAHPLGTWPPFTYEYPPIQRLDSEHASANDLRRIGFRTIVLLDG